MSFALLFHCLMLNMFRMLIHPSSGTCDLFVELFHGLYCSGSMCVGVLLCQYSNYSLKVVATFLEIKIHGRTMQNVAIFSHMN